MRLVLFDIDGTLLDCAGQTRDPFAHALEAVFGTRGRLDGYGFAGKTDGRIVLDLMAASGRSEDAVRAALPRVRTIYAEELGRRLDPGRLRRMPGVPAVLDALEARGDVVVGILTGNWEPGARLKLDGVGLGQRFAFGAYGCDGVDRHELPPVALERARRLSGRSFAPDRVLVVGDTVHDVACARAHGLRSVAVTTGGTAAEALRAAGAHRVLPDLTGPVAEWLDG